MAEIDEQAVVVEWCEWNHIPVYHTPNEGKRSYAAAAALKRAGMKSGVPDLCIPLPRGNSHGLYIEMKYGNNKPTDNQRYWIDLLIRNGYTVAVAWSADKAISIIKKYMEADERDKSRSCE